MLSANNNSPWTSLISPRFLSAHHTPRAALPIGSTILSLSAGNGIDPHR